MSYLILQCIANLFNWFSGYCHRYDGKWRFLWSASFQAEKNAYFNASRLRDEKRRWQRYHRRCWKRTCLSYCSYLSAHPPQVCIDCIEDGFKSIVPISWFKGHKKASMRLNWPSRDKDVKRQHIFNYLHDRLLRSWFDSDLSLFNLARQVLPCHLSRASLRRQLLPHHSQWTYLH